MTKMRTIRQTIELLQKSDPDTSLTEHALRMMVKRGDIPFLRIGNKVLINFNSLCQYLSPTPKSH